MKRRLFSVITVAAAALGMSGLAIARVPQSKPEVAACINASRPAGDQIAKCDAAFAALAPTDPDYGPLAIALMQAYADGGKRDQALRYGELLAASKSGAEVLVTRCVVRVIVKWDLATGLKACTDAGPDNAAALEARGQIHLLAGRWQEAWTDFDAAFRRDGAGQALYLRGIAAAALGRMAEGLKDMADGEAKAPGSAQAYERDGYSIGAVTAGKPLAPPEAFVVMQVAAPSAPEEPGVVVAKAAPAKAAPEEPGVVVAKPVLPKTMPQEPGVVVATPAAPKVTPQEPGVVAATAASAAPSAPARRFEPDAPMGVLAALSASQVQACEDDARALQQESKAWQATPDEAAMKLAMMQRTLYASRCAGHPQAASLIAAAERSILDAAPGAATAVTSAEQTTPVVTDCLEPLPVGAARNMTNSSVFRNTCAYPVTVAFCNITPVKGSWAASFACEGKTSIALMTVPASSSAPAVFGREINHFACKAPAMPVATYTPGGGLQGFCK